MSFVALFARIVYLYVLFCLSTAIIPSFNGLTPTQLLDSSDLALCFVAELYLKSIGMFLVALCVRVFYPIFET